MVITTGRGAFNLYFKYTEDRRVALFSMLIHYSLVRAGFYSNHYAK